MGEQIEPPAQRDELATGRPDRWTVVLSKVRDGLEVRHQSTGQPHLRNIALRLAFQPATRRDLADVAVDINLEQRAAVIGRAIGARARPETALSAETEFERARYLPSTQSIATRRPAISIS
jgi:hypothetical protein